VKFISCGACVNTITKELTAIKGVNKVSVDLESNSVSVTLIKDINRELLTKTLLSIGHPEATEINGLLTQLKSITSFCTGRFSN
jgi:copper chaperone